MPPARSQTLMIPGTTVICNSKSKSAKELQSNTSSEDIPSLCRHFPNKFKGPNRLPPRGFKPFQTYHPTQISFSALVLMTQVVG